MNDDQTAIKSGADVNCADDNSKTQLMTSTGSRPMCSHFDKRRS